MALFSFRDSWNVWRRKVDEALGTVEPIPASNVILDGSDVSVNSAIQQLTSADENLENQVTSLSDNVFANGSVNLLQNNGTSSTINGVTFTVNSDGTITANGTASASVDFVVSNSFYIGANKNIKISGCPSGGASDTYKARLTAQNSSTRIIDDIGQGVTYQTTTDYYGFRICVSRNTTLTNVLFKPMITVADMPNSDYEHYAPYAMSNSELTEDIGNYQIVSSEVLFVAKDDTKTISALLDELFATITTRKAALNDDEYIKITGVYIHGLGRIVDTANTLRDKTSSFVDLLCMSTNATATKFSLQRIQLKASGSKYMECEISASGNVITDKSDTVETVDGYNAKIEIIRKIK